MLFHSNGRFYRILLVCVLYGPQTVLLVFYPSIYWNPINCRFNLNKPGQNNPYRLQVKANSRLFFVCPNEAIWNDMTNMLPGLGRMYENLLLVDKLGYETCTMNKTRNPTLNREIFRCDRGPRTLRHMQEIFSRLRVTSDKMSYIPGNTYYFISTSDGLKKSLDNTEGGHCKTHHMKLQIYVCRKNESCPYIIPKCPYSNVFYDMDRATTPRPTTHTPSYNATPTRVNPRTNLTSPISQTTERVSVTDRSKRVLTTDAELLGTVRPTKADAHALSSDDRYWGTDKKNLIIHISMAIVILVLLLSLIYVCITRRRTRKDSKHSEGIDSKLYQQRPISLLPVDGEANGNVGRSMPASV